MLTSTCTSINLDISDINLMFPFLTQVPKVDNIDSQNVIPDSNKLDALSNGNFQITIFQEIRTGI